MNFVGCPEMSRAAVFYMTQAGMLIAVCDKIQSFKQGCAAHTLNADTPVTVQDRDERTRARLVVLSLACIGAYC